MQSMHRLREPAVRTEIGQHAVGDQHRAQCHRNHQQRGHELLIRRVTTQRECNRNRETYVDDRRRHRKLQGDDDGGPHRRVGEKGDVVGERGTAIHRLERQHEAVHERINKQREDEDQRGRNQPRFRVARNGGRERSARNGWRIHGVSPAYTSVHDGGTRRQIRSPTATSPVTRAHNKPNAAFTRISESWPPYSTVITSASNEFSAPGDARSISSGRIATLTRLLLKPAIGMPVSCTPFALTATPSPAIPSSVNSATFRYPMKRATCKLPGRS